MKKRYVFPVLSILIVPVFCFAGEYGFLSLNGLEGYGSLGGQPNSTIAVPKVQGGNFLFPHAGSGAHMTSTHPEGNVHGDDKGITSVTTPNRSGATVGIDREGHASVLTPGRSGGYVGFDRQGKGVLITPLAPGSQFGIDTQGNTWTLPPAR